MSVAETKMNTEHMFEESETQDSFEYDYDDYDDYDKYSEYEEEYGEEPTFEKTNRQGGVRKVRF